MGNNYISYVPIETYIFAKLKTWCHQLCTDGFVTKIAGISVVQITVFWYEDLATYFSYKNK